MPILCDIEDALEAGDPAAAAERIVRAFSLPPIQDGSLPAELYALAFSMIERDSAPASVPGLPVLSEVPILGVGDLCRRYAMSRASFSDDARAGVAATYRAWTLSLAADVLSECGVPMEWSSLSPGERVFRACLFEAGEITGNRVSAADLV